MKLNLKKILVAAALVCGAGLAVGSVNQTSAASAQPANQTSEQHVLTEQDMDDMRGFNINLHGNDRVGELFSKKDAGASAVWEKFDVENTGNFFSTGKVDEAALKRLGDVVVRIKDPNGNVIVDRLNSEIAPDFAKNDKGVLEKSGKFMLMVSKGGKFGQASEDDKKVMEDFVVKVKSENKESIKNSGHYNTAYSVDVLDKKDGALVASFNNVHLFVRNPN